MEKRSSLERRPQDTYPTPAAAIEPLLPYLRPETHFIEPCAGDGYLVGHLSAPGMCSWAPTVFRMTRG